MKRLAGSDGMPLGIVHIPSPAFREAVEKIGPDRADLSSKLTSPAYGRLRMPMSTANVAAPPLRFLEDRWDQAVADRLDAAELLPYRSNLLGSDLRITNFAGGNTSSKIRETDPLTGEPVEVLWVKGSGGDLGSMKRRSE